MVLVALIAVPFSNSFAKSKEELLKEEQELNQRIKNAEQQAAALREDSAKQMELVASLRQQTEAMQEKIDKLNTGIDSLQAEIAELNEKIEIQQNKYDEKWADYQDRLRALYVSGSVSNLEILLSADDMSDLLIRAELISSISKQDQAVINELVEVMDEIGQDKKKLTDNKASLDEDKAEVEQQKAVLDTSMAEREAIIAELEQQANAFTESEEYHKDTEQLEKIEKEMQRLANMEISGGVSGTGQMTLPCPGYSYVSANYPYYPSGSFHGGVDFAAPYGTAIVAADTGTVIAANYWNYSFGYHVMISHGGGITTLYGHASQILVRVGQNVKKGQVIARVGSTGNSTGNHLHFEVRVNGQRENPWEYL